MQVLELPAEVDNIESAFISTILHILLSFIP